MRITRICQFCNEEFTAKTTKTKFCSLKCGSRNYKLITRHMTNDVSIKETEKAGLQDFAAIKKKDYLSIADCVQFLGISRRTLYRMMVRNDVDTVKLGRRRFVVRKSVEAIFAVNKMTTEKPDPVPRIVDLSQCCTITEAQQRYGVSPTALYFLIRKHNINKFTVGKFTYVQKKDLDVYLKSIGDE